MWLDGLCLAVWRPQQGAVLIESQGHVAPAALVQHVLMGGSAVLAPVPMAPATMVGAGYNHLVHAHPRKLYAEATT
jgi:hypothetical protein